MCDEVPDQSLTRWMNERFFLCGGPNGLNCLPDPDVVIDISGQRGRGKTTVTLQVAIGLMNSDQIVHYRGWTSDNERIIRDLLEFRLLHSKYVAFDRQQMSHSKVYEIRDCHIPLDESR